MAEPETTNSKARSNATPSTGWDLGFLVLREFRCPSNFFRRGVKVPIQLCPSPPLSLANFLRPQLQCKAYILHVDMQGDVCPRGPERRGSGGAEGFPPPQVRDFYLTWILSASDPFA